MDMTARKISVRIGELIIHAPDGADLAGLERTLRDEIVAALSAGVLPPPLASDAPVLWATHALGSRGGWEGIGASLTRATPPGRKP